MEFGFFDVLFIFIIIIIIITISKKKDNKVLIFGSENFNKVNDLPNKEESAKILDEIKKRLQILIDYCNKTETNETNDLDSLNARFDPNNIQEADIDDDGTSFTIDKGKELHLCLRDKTTFEHHDINTLMFVAIHELSHIMSTSYGHNNEFADNFVYLLNKAVEAGVYTKVNYKENNKKFCGIVIDSSPLFN